MSHGDLLLASRYVSGNRLLDALPLGDRAGLAADVEIVTIAAHTFTHSADAVVEFVDFPIDAVISVVVALENGDMVEVGTVGCEGFVECDVALNAERAQRTSYCQVGGTVGRMTAARFAARMAGSPSFAGLMRRNVRAALFSAQQFAACNAEHSILQRCARWLSMTEDRVGQSHFMLTHEYLSILMGVRRASVSEAADALATLGAIAYHRGAVTVLDKTLLNGATCECYAACKQAFDTSLPG